MWLAASIGSALFAGLTAILAKCGIRKTDSDIATAIRTIVVLIFSWVMVFIVGSADQITEITPRSLLFLILSGAATGGIMDLLLQSPIHRRCQQGCANRQVKHGAECFACNPSVP